MTLTAKKYLSPLKKFGADVLILGCTHYPIIKDVIAGVVKIPLIDSAAETAKEVRRILEERKILRHDSGKPKIEFFVTDAPEKFVQTGERFLGRRISNISRVNIGG
ncbi:MAG: hypothetical protein U0937_00050 [Thermodesulfovibrionia bacterium]|nr:hypothetical protein [Thermodesulfovibrionia bacterium]